MCTCMLQKNMSRILDSIAPVRTSQIDEINCNAFHAPGDTLKQSNFHNVSPWQLFPFMDLGKTLIKLNDLVNFSTVRGELLKLIPKELNHTTCSITNIMRKYLMCEGLAGACVKEWFGALEMCPNATAVHKKLGTPTVEQFSLLIGRMESSIHLGFYMHYVADVVHEYLTEITSCNETFLEELQTLPGLKPIWETPPRCIKKVFHRKGNASAQTCTEAR